MTKCPSHDDNNYHSELYKEMNKLVMSLYMKNAKESLSDVFEDFLKTKRISRDVAEKFNLGIASSDNQISDYINSLEDDEKMKWQSLALSLKIVGEKDNKIYDYYKNRIIFPIINKFGDVAGFSTRKYGDNALGPLYLNSPESSAFSKKNILYGENLVFNVDKDCADVVLVEGFMDVIRLYEKGFTNVLGLIRTTILSDSCALDVLSKFKEIYLALDNDEAGSFATLKITEKLLDQGCLPKSIDLSPFRDPEDFLKELSREEFEKRIRSAEAKLS